MKDSVVEWLDFPEIIREIWHSPIDYNLIPTSDSESFHNMPVGSTGIPITPHPGAFRAVRKYNIHP